MNAFADKGSQFLFQSSTNNKIHDSSLKKGSIKVVNLSNPIDLIQKKKKIKEKMLQTSQDSFF